MAYPARKGKIVMGVLKVFLLEIRKIKAYFIPH
jgi:hypothetical protein